MFRDGVVNDPVVLVPPPPVELQDVLLVEDQPTIEVEPDVTDDGVAVREITGAPDTAGTTVTVVLWIAVPPGPVHVTEYVVLVVIGRVVNDPVIPV